MKERTERTNTNKISGKLKRKFEREERTGRKECEGTMGT